VLFVETTISNSKTPRKQEYPMAIERTFSMIKPDATKRNLTGAITARLEEAGLRVVASKRVWMSLKQAEGFYAEHSERPFFGELTEFMSSGPTIVQVLEGENAVLKNREIMGATNPEEADAGTIRKEHAIDIGENSVHGSDSLENAKIEMDYFFNEDEIVG
jgi:nucleoside-diphosphate kinase